MMSASSLVLKALGLLVLVVLVRFFVRLYQVRMLFREAASKYGAQMMPHSFLFGHLPEMVKVSMKYPRDVDQQPVPYLLLREHPHLTATGMLYMDVWPIGPPMVAVIHPDIMAQYTQTVSLPKAPIMQTEFGPFTNCDDLVNQEGKDWKTWRSIFNPGFSMNNIITLVPEFLEEIQVFKDWLVSAAKSGQVVAIDPQALRVTVDVIARAVLGVRIHTQTTENPMFNALRDQITWLLTDNSPEGLRRWIHPLRHIMVPWNNRIIRNYLTPLIRRGIASYGSEEASKSKTINSLAIKSYLKEVQSTKAVSTSNTLVDPAFAEMAISQMKIFIFAGHDTTASTLSFTYHLLCKHPDKLAKLRAEFDQVFGPNPSQTLQQLKTKPHLLNQLPYATAVIKETLRMFTPLGGVRQGQKDFFLTHPETGQRHPTEGLMLWSAFWTTHRLDEYFPHASTFLPERWLAREGDPLHVRKNAFRVFEQGPRTCIGQELAMVELRAILAMTLRDLDVESAYPDDAESFLGDKAYQVKGSKQLIAHPSHDMPVRVKFRSVKVA